jgi:hypothetical protein
MMMKINLFILFILCSSAVHAQDNYFYINWDVNTPLTNKEWLSNTSARGAKLGFRKFIGTDRKFSAGVDVNWSYFQEYKPTETFQQPGGALTTDYFNDIFQFAAAASGQYYFPVGNREHFFPYAGIGLGASRNNYTVSYNIYKDEESSWGFLARPEAGILVRIGTRRKLGAMAAVHYDYSTSKSERYDYGSFSSIGFQLGIMLIQW